MGEKEKKERWAERRDEQKYPPSSLSVKKGERKENGGPKFTERGEKKKVKPDEICSSKCIKNGFSPLLLLLLLRPHLHHPLSQKAKKNTEKAEKEKKKGRIFNKKPKK
jgi:hypothetical protein